MCGSPVASRSSSASPSALPSKTVRAARGGGRPGAIGLFPALDADLEIASLGRHRTQLAMSARYVPPLGALGRSVDRAVLYRVAEATLKDFLDRVRDSVLVEADDATSARHPGPA